MQLLQAYDARQEGDLQAFEAEKLKERESKLNAENKKAEAVINITRDNKKITNDGISLLYNTALKITTTDAQIEQSNLDRQTKLDVQKISRDAAIRVAQIQTEYKGRENTRAAILEQRKVLMKAFNKMKENLADTGYDEAKITEFMEGYQAEIKELDRRYNALFGKVPITGEPTTGSVKNYVDIAPAKRELGLQ
jgi:chromosome segregation ATPase